VIQRSDCIVNATALISTAEIARLVKRKSFARVYHEVFHGIGIVNRDM